MIDVLCMLMMIVTSFWTMVSVNFGYQALVRLGMFLWDNLHDQGCTYRSHARIGVTCTVFIRDHQHDQRCSYRITRTNRSVPMNHTQDYGCTYGSLVRLREFLWDHLHDQGVPMISLTQVCSILHMISLLLLYAIPKGKLTDHLAGQVVGPLLDIFL